MNAVDLLLRKDPELASLVVSARGSRIHELAMRAAEFALMDNDLADLLPLKDQDLRELDRARELAEQEYYSASDSDRSPKSTLRRLFRRERALTAAVAAIATTTLDDAADAVYEALFAVDDAAELREILRPSPGPEQFPEPTP